MDDLIAFLTILSLTSIAYGVIVAGIAVVLAVSAAVVAALLPGIVVGFVRALREPTDS